MHVNLHDAKTNLSRYVEQALGFLQGSEVLDCDLKAELLLWLAISPERLPATLRGTLMDRRLPMLYGVVSLWELTIKTSLGKPGFVVDAAQLRDGLKQQGHQLIWMGDGGAGG